MTCSVCICIVGTNDGHACHGYGGQQNTLSLNSKPDFLLNLTDSLHALTTHSGEPIALPLAHACAWGNNYSFLTS